MTTPRRSLLSMLDNAVRWTGIPARVADQLSDAPTVDDKHRPLCWVPIWMIAGSGVLFMLSLSGQFAQILMALVPSMSAIMVAFTPLIHHSGPLGRPSLDDDEREAALRKNSFLICFALLAFLNCLGQPLLMILSHLQHWQTAHSVSVAVSALMLNCTLFGCLPTLYASWHLRPLPTD